VSLNWQPVFGEVAGGELTRVSNTPIAHLSIWQFQAFAQKWDLHEDVWKGNPQYCGLYTAHIAILELKGYLQPTKLRRFQH